MTVVLPEEGAPVRKMFFLGPSIFALYQIRLLSGGPRGPKRNRFRTYKLLVVFKYQEVAGAVLFHSYFLQISKIYCTIRIEQEAVADDETGCSNRG